MPAGGKPTASSSNIARYSERSSSAFDGLAASLSAASLSAGWSESKEEDNEEAEREETVGFLSPQDQLVSIDLSPPDWTGTRGWKAWTKLEHISVSLANPLTAIARGPEADVAFADAVVKEVKLKSDPFARGGRSLVFYCLVKSDMKKYVLRKLVDANLPYKNRDEALKAIARDLVRIQLLAKQAAIGFMNKVRSTGVLGGGGLSCEYIDIEVVRDNTTSDWRYWTIEPLLEGAWDKYNDNAGSVSTSPHNDFAQALSHFSYEYFSKRIILVDVQGTLANQHFAFTRPSFHSVDSAFGPTDLGANGIDTFFETHKCGATCQALGLPKHPKQQQ